MKKLPIQVMNSTFKLKVSMEKLKLLMSLFLISKKLPKESLILLTFTAYNFKNTVAINLSRLIFLVAINFN
jgi:hypothetical protein